MTITPLPNKQIDYIWNKVKGYFEICADTTNGRYTANDLRTMIKTRDKQLWISHEDEEIYGFAITSLLDYPQMRVLMMNFTGGREFHKWHKPIMDTFREFAKNNGCEELEAHGRAGWTKVFKDEGYSKMNDVFRMPVEIE